MSEEAEKTIEILNDLLRAEATSLVRRLGEAAPFVAGEATGEAAVLVGMVADRGRNVEALTNAIVDLGGSAVPQPLDASTGNLHYLELDYLVPRLLTDEQRMVEVYEKAAGGVGSELAWVQVVVEKALGRHRDHLGQLERLRRGASAGNQAE